MTLKEYSQPSHCQEQNFCSHKSKKSSRSIDRRIKNY
jgi:hypothetical protein